MSGHKRIKGLLIFLLTVMICSSASAGTCITALATPVNPDRLACIAVNARITGYDAGNNVLILELTVPEVFSGEEVRNLQAGDSIYSQGREILIQSVEPDEAGSLRVNSGKSEDGTLWLREDPEGNYRATDGEKPLWSVLTEVQAPVTESLLFLDGIYPESGAQRALPAVYTAGQLPEMLAAEEDGAGAGFGKDNVYAVFDAEGRLAVIERYAVPSEETGPEAGRE